MSMNWFGGFNPEMQLGATPMMKPQEPQGLGDWLAAQPPEKRQAMMRQVLEHNNLGNTRVDLERQLAMANALRKPSGHRYSTGWGAALGGLGDVVQQAHGGYKANKADEALAANTKAMANPELYNNELMLRMMNQTQGSGSANQAQIIEMLRKMNGGT